MRKLKIMRIIARLNVGGPAIHVVLLSSAFNNEMRETILVSGRVEPEEGDMTYFATKYGVAPVIIPELSRKINLKRDLISLYRIYRLMRRERPDIVHTHTAKAGTLGRIAALMARVPIRIHTFHGHIFEGYFSALQTHLFLFVERMLAYGTHMVITVSEQMRKDLVSVFKITKPFKVRVVHLGFDLNEFFDSEVFVGNLRRELGISEASLLIGIVGRLVPIKNHKMFFDAALKVLESWSGPQEAKFIVIGDGELQEELMRYVSEINLTGSVIFLGWRKDLKSIYADLDIVALTSLNEGTPVSLIEAMASGKPVVSTDVGGVRDVVLESKTGFLVPANATETFADRLYDLLKDEGLRRRFGSEGRRIARERFSAERLIGDMEALYSEFKA